MKRIELEIDGKPYPCRQTMGALLRFKQETGKDATEITNSASDMCAFLYCCVKSACKHDNIEFKYSLMDFADGLLPEDIERAVSVLNEETAEAMQDSADADGEQKKS